MKTLQEIYKPELCTHGSGDKGTAHSYIDMYETLLAPYRDCTHVLEIGTSVQSLHMWQEYFHRALVIGIDQNAVPISNTLVCDATNEEQMCEELDRYFGEEDTLDVVIDDASHLLDDQIKTYKILQQYMSKRSIYVIEDVLCITNAQEIVRQIGVTAEIIDLRHVKNRFDDILVAIWSK